MYFLRSVFNKDSFTKKKLCCIYPCMEAAWQILRIPPFSAFQHESAFFCLYYGALRSGWWRYQDAETASNFIWPPGRLSFTVFLVTALKGPSDQIKSAWKWYLWIGLGMILYVFYHFILSVVLFKRSLKIYLIISMLGRLTGFMLATSDPYQLNCKKCGNYTALSKIKSADNAAFLRIFS
jgi:hypothetical protein